jgi:hypothetical protein
MAYPYLFFCVKEFNPFVLIYCTLFSRSKKVRELLKVEEKFKKALQETITYITVIAKRIYNAHRRRTSDNTFFSYSEPLNSSFSQGRIKKTQVTQADLPVNSVVFRAIYEL